MNKIEEFLNWIYEGRVFSWEIIYRWMIPRTEWFKITKEKEDVINFTKND